MPSVLRVKGKKMNDLIEKQAAIDAVGLNTWAGFRISQLQAVDVVPARHGAWVKMSDADGTYYICSECGEELPRVVVSFNPQFDLFPELKCIDRTTYCPNCGCKMDR